ncbi:MAG: glycosyltransferase family 4 protein [Alicyclobacillus macrosporangiidus]|uniref:glycosyltransferase family 4 protein n=1 Tax=Alicyclobacillus macrosporangiidus TaxID=392015 RepID=UPI0026EBFEDC|nr:glycosyltransferase family 4 protein [Alicyclobacillus macrosporangiidus]MCL6598837.1 glycosyltransferase family 4 protein [Alicyclobacillus macrosporangiidus]
MTLKILLVNTFYHPDNVGGAEFSVRLLAEELLRHGDMPIVVATKPHGSDSVETVNGVRVYRLNIENLYWPHPDTKASIPIKVLWHFMDIHNRRMGKKLSDILGAECPEVVHTHNLAGFSSAVWHACWHHNVPIVHTIRDFYVLCFRRTMYKNGFECTRICPECRIFKSVRAADTRFVDTVVGVSRSVLDTHLRHGAFAHAAQKVIYNPFNPVAKHKQVKGIEQMGGTSSPIIRFGYLGQLLPVKGIEVLLEAFVTLPFGTCELLIAGTGKPDYVRYLQSRYSAQNIKFLGFVSPDELLSRIDVLVVPSLWSEPMGRVVVEAYAAGIPVIASSRGGLKETVDDGNTGLLFDPDERGSLYRSMWTFVREPELLNRMRENALRRAKDYEPEVVARQYRTVYQETVALTRRKRSNTSSV